MSNKKFLRPKDVEDIYSIKVSTLSKQRQENTVTIMLLDVRAINKERYNLIQR